MVGWSLLRRVLNLPSLLKFNMAYCNTPSFIYLFIPDIVRIIRTNIKYNNKVTRKNLKLSTMQTLCTVNRKEEKITKYYINITHEYMYTYISMSK